MQNDGANHNPFPKFARRLEQPALPRPAYPDVCAPRPIESAASDISPASRAALPIQSSKHASQSFSRPPRNALRTVACQNLGIRASPSTVWHARSHYRVRMLGRCSKYTASIARRREDKQSSLSSSGPDGGSEFAPGFWRLPEPVDSLAWPSTLYCPRHPKRFDLTHMTTWTYLCADGT